MGNMKERTNLEDPEEATARSADLDGQGGLD